MIAEPLRRFFEARQACFAIHRHASRPTAAEVAEVAHVPGRQLAKVVLIRALTHPPGQLLLAVVPAHTEIDLAALHARLGFPVELARRGELERVFPGCDPTALPPVGAIATEHVPVFVDPAFAAEPRIAFPGGTSTELVEMSWREFCRTIPHTLIACSRPRVPGSPPLRAS